MAKDATGNITGWGVERQALEKGRDKLSCYCSHVIATGNARLFFLFLLCIRGMILKPMFTLCKRICDLHQ